MGHINADGELKYIGSVWPQAGLDTVAKRKDQFITPGGN
jgi:hypothetical protein